MKKTVRMASVRGLLGRSVVLLIFGTVQCKSIRFPKNPEFTVLGIMQTYSLPFGIERERIWHILDGYVPFAFDVSQELCLWVKPVFRDLQDGDTETRRTQFMAY